MKKLFGTDGVRGKANVELTPELAFRLGKCASHVFAEKLTDRKNAHIVIGTDTRISCDMIESALTAGITAEGINVISVGVVPTPAMPKIIEKTNAICGIMISASHNPAEFNGIKFFNDKGLKLDDEVENHIESIYYNGYKTNHDEHSIHIGRKYTDENLKNVYIDSIVNSVSEDLSKLKIAVDLANGANYEISKKVLKKLTLNPLYLADNPNGININLNCGSTHLENLKKTVVENKLDLGIAFDGDADRVLMVDENGNDIDGDRMMLALAIHMKKNNTLKNNSVVGTVMSNMGLYKALSANDIKFISTKVGDRYVLEKMFEDGYNLGGEQSGHIIQSNFNSTGDGLYTAVKMLEIIATSYEKASDITNLMQTYPQVLVNVNVPNHIKYDLITREDVKSEIYKIENDLKGKGRALLRASGTEPIVRVMVEADDIKLVNEYSNILASFIKNLNY